MSKTILIAAASLAALTLAACNQNRPGSASAVCKPFTTASTTTTAASPTNVLPAAAVDVTGGLDDCLHRWAYTLAGSSDPANLVADATLAACSDQLAGWNRQSISSGVGGGASVEAPSLVNGQTTNPLAEHYAFAQGRALFYVVQARAGHCGPPPAASAGTTTTTNR